MQTSKEEDNHPRSNFIKALVQNTNTNNGRLLDNNKILKKIVQFWDNLERLPEDVNECIQSWH